MSFEIVTDSSATLSTDLLREFGITILPLSYMNQTTGVQKPINVFDEAFDMSDYYNQMKEGTVYTTSLPNVAESKATLTKIAETGSDILYIGFDSGISGTYESTAAQLDEIAEQFPHQKFVHIDTLCAAGGEGLLVYYACRMKQQGASFEEIISWVKQHMVLTETWFTTDDLKYLVRGGRVSKTAGVAGALLNINPILHVESDGSLQSNQKVRGRKKALNALIEHFDQNHAEITDDYVVSINHADCYADAEYLRDKLTETYGVKTVFIDWLDPVIGSHTGPGCIVLSYLCSSKA